MSILQAFLDGVTGAGLFGKLDWPGAPTEFIDSRTPQEFDAKQAAQKLYAEKFPSIHLKPKPRASSSERHLRKE
jgi:hypothetical protein